jgi:hypothetical protein
MSTRIDPGDMCVVVTSREFPDNVGAFVTAIALHPSGNDWLVASPTPLWGFLDKLPYQSASPLPNGAHLILRAADLHPIKGLPKTVKVNETAPLRQSVPA